MLVLVLVAITSKEKGCFESFKKARGPNPNIKHQATTQYIKSFNSRRVIDYVKHISTQHHPYMKNNDLNHRDIGGLWRWGDDGCSLRQAHFPSRLQWGGKLSSGDFTTPEIDNGG